MPTGYVQIPDWFSFENQGAGIATGDLTGNGSNDIVVLTVDNPQGQNRGIYRVGRALNDQGVVSGGSSPWTDVPNWFSFENQGAGTALFDIDNDGRLELFVFMIDNAPGVNQGLYRVGKGLDVSGNVTGGWGPWIPIPNWFSFENQHGAITVADIDQNGRPELIVFMVDNPAGQNQGKFQIGADLDVNGNVTGNWSGWIDVPDWFSWENQGAGVAVTDLDGDGKPDLLVFQIDNAVEQNQAFYKVGQSLDINGTVAGWSPWRGVPAWFSWENQGGGIATTRRNGKAEMVVMMVDNPPGKNVGYYRVLPLDVDPTRDGRWDLLPYHSGVLAVHAALLPGGNVLFFAGSGSSATRFAAPEFGDMTKGIFTSVVWDPQVPAPGGFFHPDTPFAPNGRPFDFFCGGDAFLPDGAFSPPEAPATTTPSSVARTPPCSTRTRASGPS